MLVFRDPLGWVQPIPGLPPCALLWKPRAFFNALRINKHGFFMGEKASGKCPDHSHHCHWLTYLQYPTTWPLPSTWAVSLTLPSRREHCHQHYTYTKTVSSLPMDLSPFSWSDRQSQTQLSRNLESGHGWSVRHGCAMRGKLNPKWFSKKTRRFHEQEDVLKNGWDPSCFGTSST